MPATADREFDSFWMERCFQLAEAAGASGDAPVGAVLVRKADNREIAAAKESAVRDSDITGHAEVTVLRLAVATLATNNLSDYTLYTTTEPCWMCSYLLRELHVARIVIGKPLFDIGGASSVYPILRDRTVSEWGPPPEIIFFEEN
ncbi:MAG: nucleoside deaminase [Armatimonadota bacterium]